MSGGTRHLPPYSGKADFLMIVRSCEVGVTHRVQSTLRRMHVGSASDVEMTGLLGRTLRALKVRYQLEVWDISRTCIFVMKWCAVLRCIMNHTVWRQGSVTRICELGKESSVYWDQGVSGHLSSCHLFRKGSSLRRRLIVWLFSASRALPLVLMLQASSLIKKAQLGQSVKTANFMRCSGVYVEFLLGSFEINVEWFWVSLVNRM